MAVSFWFFFGTAVAILLVLIFLLREPASHQTTRNDLGGDDRVVRQHIAFFSQITQALAKEDLTFLAARGNRAVARRVRKERRRIVLAYLSCLRTDFANLWRLARVIAAMSPSVGPAQEFARFRRGVAFHLRYEWIRLQFIFGFAPLARLDALSQVVGNLAMRLETAMSDLGERAALATELASTFDRSGLNAP